VKETAEDIVKGKKTTSPKRARSTSGWWRTPSAMAKTLGCGVGDITT